MRDGSDPADPVRIVSVGRAVAKKGFGDLLRALAALPPDLHWRFAHVGGGDLLNSLKAQVAESGLGDRVAFLGAKAQPDIIALLRDADLFALPSKKAASGDRDGLPNVLMEAAEPETRHRGDATSPASPNSFAPGSTASWCRRANGNRFRMPSIFWRANRNGALRWRIPPSSGCGGIFPWRAAST